ncbi:MAG: RagB/SusD family nutrient uptake outer membrane protein, partial [Bacteroidales bacterium]|nr:RagB/SusD family nutrient uptake outer membrane protein [Bacteroidales bacterium]
MKAASMFEIVKLFAEPYTKNQNALGVMLVDSYNPTSDASTYPARSTVKETYDFIDNYLTKAASKLSKVQGSKASIYLTIDAVTALQARVALCKGDWQTAATKAASLVDGGKYPLITFENVDLESENAQNQIDDVLAAFNNLWTNDSGEECIMQLWADYEAGSLPSSLSYGYISMNASGVYAPDFIPEQWVIDLYSDVDIRGAVWYGQHFLNFSSVSGNAIILKKFPGNRALQDASVTTSDYINKIKPFRIAEQYLIAAEAYAALGNDEAAYNYYSKLVAARTLGFEGMALTGETLKKAIKEERVKELIGEGFRFYDLKRYGEGFARGNAQNADIITGAGSELTEKMVCAANNFRWLWPIPQAEIDSNPQISEQQNPGY